MHCLNRTGCVEQAFALATLLVAMLKLTTSAERRLAASSKLVRVRVEFSKNRLHTMRPRSVGHLFHRAGEDALHAFRVVEDAGDLFSGKFLESKQMATIELKRLRRGWGGRFGSGFHGLKRVAPAGRWVKAEDESALAIRRPKQKGRPNGAASALEMLFFTVLA
jgi:hypothetical protein